jgi:C4-dicarboxylate transporter, DctM subunit
LISIAPDISYRELVWGTLPFDAIMIMAVVLICAFPDIAMWLPRTLMG